ncbi:solute carrier family 35 member G1 isoform X2 [Poeciliopsis prolifica]|uniref:solute carrier family 35 member G1 isoform X2 n=1 Tax=Poeciliopsis prolifica TaxID=188132 RepID=UPI002413D5FF|nr:solute carrier family 35 member G1 isoform X2 [Poeciliopsis prolifica]
MGECNNCTRERVLTAEDNVTVAFHKVVSHDKQNQVYHHREEDERGDDEQTDETVHLRTNYPKGEDVEEKQRARGSENVLEGGEKETLLCMLPAFCTRGKETASPGEEKPPEEQSKKCPGLGLFYALVATVFFSIIAMVVKTIEGVHAVEISAIRCFFQMIFVIPLLIYHKIDFLGPRDKRIYLVLRGFLGSNAMILLYYAVQQMPLADATVIMFSNPVFTSLLAWVFLKERCTIWDCVFTMFTLTGVILIARPPFLFGEHLSGIEGNYTNHVKGTLAAFGGKSVHYYLSVWYYAVIGLLECIITTSILGEWNLPFCGQDRWMLMLIALLGIAGQSFLTKALQHENAGPVALMRTVDVVLAFFFQFVVFQRVPTWWSFGGALCVVLSTSGVALRKWYNSSRKK